MSIKTDFLPSCLSCSDSCCTGDILVSTDERGRILERWRGSDPLQHNVRFDYYYLDIDECPFLSESGLCRIHNVRPVMCRLFPLSIVPLKSGGFRLQLDQSCPVATTLSPDERQSSRKMATRFLKEVGRETFLAFYESW